GEETKPFSLLANQTIEKNSKRKWSDSYLALTQARSADRSGASFYYRGNQDGELVNWINNMSVPTILPPYYKGAAGSTLITMLVRKSSGLLTEDSQGEQGHEGVKLSQEELDKIACWIDLLVPYCGDYAEANAWTQEEMDKYDRFMKKRRRMEEIERKNIEELVAAESTLEKTGVKTAEVDIGRSLQTK
ncbi:unnamed protein product, partial [marine sediment metagenome]